MFQCILHYLRTIYLGIIKQKNHLVSHFFRNETLFDHEQDVVDTHHVGLPCVSFLLPIWDVSSFKSKYKSTWHENHWLCKSNIFSRFTNLPRGHCSLSLEQLAPKKINFTFRFFLVWHLSTRFQISYFSLPPLRWPRHCLQMLAPNYGWVHGRGRCWRKHPGRANCCSIFLCYSR